MSDEAFEGLRLRFAERLRRDLTELETIAGHADLLADTDRLALVSHSLAGSAGVFGFAAVGQRALALEILMTSDEPVDEATVKAALVGLVEEIRRSLE